jgi:DNA mismatch repair protein MutL
LNHSIVGAFDQLLGDGHFPLYLIYLEIDPAQIDINIHPTKTEIKFQDERAIYAILHAAVKRALGRHNISPTLDFNQEVSISIDPMRKDIPIREPQIAVNPHYNPFETKPKRESLVQGWFDNKQQVRKGWEELMEISRMVENTEIPVSESVDKLFEIDEDVIPMQWNRQYLLVPMEDTMLLVDQQRAHRKVLFERYTHLIEKGQGNIQQLLFPEVLELNASDFALMQSMLDDIRALGFDIEEFGGHSFQLLGIPADANVSDAEKLMEEFL